MSFFHGRSFMIALYSGFIFAEKVLVFKSFDDIFMKKTTSMAVFLSEIQAVRLELYTPKVFQCNSQREICIFE